MGCRAPGLPWHSNISHCVTSRYCAPGSVTVRTASPCPHAAVIPSPAPPNVYKFPWKRCLCLCGIHSVEEACMELTLPNAYLWVFQMGAAYFGSCVNTIFFGMKYVCTFSASWAWETLRTGKKNNLHVQRDIFSPQHLTLQGKLGFSSPAAFTFTSAFAFRPGRMQRDLAAIIIS